MGNDSSRLIREDMQKRYPGDPTRQVYEAAKSGNAIVLSEFLEQMNASERASALETKTTYQKKFLLWATSKFTPLLVAAEHGYLNCVKVLLRYNADTEARGDYGNSHEGCTALHVAASKEHIDVLSCLVENGADIDARTKDNCTPLMIASRHNRVNAVTFLVEHGANINLKDKHGNTALHYAVRRGLGSCDILLCLVKNGADVDACTNDNCTPLMTASEYGHVNVVTFLVEHGAKMDLQDRKGNTAFHYAVRFSSTDVACKLLTLGASQLYNNDQLTPLLLASNQSKFSVVEKLIKQPECTKEQRIDALELLGACLATKSLETDAERAFEYMKRGMEERFEDPSNPLLKQPMEPVEAYQNRKESQTLEELAQIKGNDVANFIEGLIIRERILGTDDKGLCDRIQILANKYRFSGDFDISLRLFIHSLEMYQHYDKSRSKTLFNITDVLHDIVQLNCPPKEKFILQVLEQTVIEHKKQTEKFKFTEELEEEHNAKSRKQLIADVKWELDELMSLLLKLLKIFAKVRLAKEDKNLHVTVLLQKLCRLNPCDTGCGSTLLHLAAQSVFDSNNPESQFQFPCIKTIKLLLEAGFDVNAINNSGDTPLHTAVTFTPSDDKLHILIDMLEVLLDGGAHHDFVNNDSKTAMDLAATDDARRILSERKTLELKCIAARAVKKFGLPYLGVVPKRLEKYISMH